MNIDQPKVSLVINAYNSEKTLRETLDSAIAQTLKELEIICVDDGSKDRTVSIADEYKRKHSGFRVLALEKNMGLVSARKAGVLASKGKYLMFLDGDDKLLPNACADLSNAMDEKKTDIVQFGTEYIIEKNLSNDEVKGMTDFFSVRRTGLLHGSAELMEACFCRKDFSWNVWNKIYRLDLIRDIYRSFPDVHLIIDDYFSIFQIFSKAETCWVTKDKYYQYRVGCGVSSNQKKPEDYLKRVERCYAGFKYLKEYTEKNPAKEKYRALEALSKAFRQDFLQYWIFPQDQYHVLLPRKMQEYGMDQIAKMLLEHWLKIKEHPIKKEFFRIAAALPARKQKTIVSLGIILYGNGYDSSLQKTLQNLTTAGYQLHLFGPSTIDLTILNEIPAAVFTELPEDSEKRMEILYTSSKNQETDAFISFYASENRIDFDLIALRLVCGLPFFTILLPGIKTLSCNDMMTLCAADAVISSEPQWGKSFGAAGMMQQESAAEISRILSAFTENASCSRGKFLPGVLGERIAAVRTFYHCADGESGIGESDYRKMQSIALQENSIFLQEYARLSSGGKDQDPIRLFSQSAYFDKEWYLEQNPDVKESGEDPIEHYLNTGWKEGRDPSSHFDTEYMLKNNPYLREHGINPLYYFLIEGYKYLQLPNTFSFQISFQEYRAIRASGFFDDEFYRSHFSRSCIADPILHFCNFGWKIMADPSSKFSVESYYLANLDVYYAKINPLTHYLLHGKAETRQIRSDILDTIQNSDFFDAEKYTREHGEELNGLSPAVHYSFHGWKKLYDPSDKFSESAYADFYVEMHDLNLPRLYHYLHWGKEEGRCAFPVKGNLTCFWPENFDIAGFNARRDKILIAVHQLDFTGVPILGRMIAEIFIKDGNAAIISPMDGPLRADCVKRGIPVIIDSNFYVKEDCTAKYRENGYVFCLFNTLGLINTYLRVSSKIPSILWVHDNLPASYLPERVREKIKDSPTVFATSSVTTELVRTYADHVRFLPYPIRDMAKSAKKAVPRKFRFGVFGQYNERKGQDIAIEAYQSLPENVQEKAELLLVGAQTTAEYYEGLKTSAAGHPGIRFIPAQKDSVLYHQMYDQIEVQICSSRTDPMPLVVFDGMMHGCPVILSDKVGQQEYIENGLNGFVFPSEDANALSECMKKIIENPEKFAELSRNIRQTFLDNFELSKAETAIREVIRETTKLYPHLGEGEQQS